MALQKDTKIKREYLAWKKKQPKSDRTSFAQWVRATYPGYKEPRYGSTPRQQQERGAAKQGMSRPSQKQMGTLSRDDYNAVMKMLKRK